MMNKVTRKLIGFCKDAGKTNLIGDKLETDYDLSSKNHIIHAATEQKDEDHPESY